MPKQKQLNLPKKIRVGTRWYSVEVVEAMRNKSEIDRKSTRLNSSHT